MIAIGEIPVEDLAARYRTPLYVYDERVLIEQFQRLRSALPPAIDIYYSVKANPHPKIISVFLKQDAGCEIASGGEYVLARRAGSAADKIVFAGPGKGREELEFVIAQGIGEVHLESFEEIEILDQISHHLSATVNVSVRMNPSAAIGGGLLMGGQATAFGFEEEVLGKVVQTLSDCKRFRLRGVHLYTGTQILDAEALLAHWKHAIELATKTADLTGEPISTIDLGGGLGIPYFAHETEINLETLRRGATILIDGALADRRLANANFVVEPGRFLVGPAGTYVARVRSVKDCRGTTFVVLDGGMNHNLAASGNLGQVIRRDYPIVNLSRRGDSTESTVVVVGPLCTPIDTLGRKVTMALPRPGDLIGILQSGAYGLTASPVRFLSHPTPAEVMVWEGGHELITPRQAGFDPSNPDCASP